MLEANRLTLVRHTTRISIIAIVTIVSFFLLKTVEQKFDLKLPPFLTLYPAVMLVALLCGLWYGLLATVISALLALLWLLPPLGICASADLSQIVALVVFVGMGVSMSLVAEHFRRSQGQLAGLKAKLAIEENSKRYHSILENSRDIIYSQNLQTDRFEYVSPSIETIMGFSQDHFYRLDGESALQMVHPDDRAALRKSLQNVNKFDKGEAEYRFIHSNGSYRLFSNHVSIVRDAAGVPLFLNGNIRDITETKKTEMALVENARRSALALEACYAGFFEWDYVNHIVHFSPELERLHGLEPGAFDGSVEQWSKLAMPEDFPVLLESLHQASKTGEFKIDGRIIRQNDGEVRWMSAQGKLLFDDAGNLIRMVGIASDITDRIRTEEKNSELLYEVQEERDRLSALINSMNDEVWFFDTKKQFNMANPAALREFCIDDSATNLCIVGPHNPPEIYRPDLSPLPLDELPSARAQRGEVIKNQETIVRTPASGSLRHRLSNATPVKDANGNIIGSVTVVRDITERKLMEDQLRALTVRLETSAERERQRIARELHDQLGPVLTGLKLDFDWIIRKHSFGEKEWLPIMLGAINSIDSTIALVRKLSIDLRPEMLDQLGLAASIRCHANTLMKSAGITCKINVPEIRLRLSNDHEITVFRIFQEAITNIVRHARANNVFIHLTAGPADAILTIVDDGIGFLIKSVRPHHSLGILGMSERAKLVGADLNIQSSPGKGTTVTLRIPTSTVPQQAKIDLEDGIDFSISSASM